ncbi:hypothetical protein PQ478_12485 [Alkalihalophilus pseudofirmus]|uniref:hypothetical protein n=1 Tax=Alkalihalophilus pseudofirmus TaxID=79885 RepID=UPI00259BDFE4|nr:hypothetical protein [Alkalihalophilus pseudofirmus]WEG15356.1 hypothetical protein PQ478_12485 [Alkalihalophilus pseudofirmus]
MGRFNSLDSNYHGCGCGSGSPETHHHHHKPKKDKQKCEGCFCNEFKGETNVALAKLVVDDRNFVLDERDPFFSSPPLNICRITLVRIKDCCATFRIVSRPGGSPCEGDNPNIQNYTFTTDCKNIVLYEEL